MLFVKKLSILSQFMHSDMVCFCLVENSEELTPRSKVMLVPQLMALLKECLASHRWTEVVELLKALGLETKNTSVTLWKASPP